MVPQDPFTAFRYWHKWQRSKKYIVLGIGILSLLIATVLFIAYAYHTNHYSTVISAVVFLLISFGLIGYFIYKTIVDPTNTDNVINSAKRYVLSGGDASKLI